ncbi:MAG: hypothetical protein QOD06_2482, partial [Candidatus Binatota bacterium]|nr:hypothetical protein [Candidatus Binatota bacterium]
FAPTIVQETRAERFPRDYIAAADFDGDRDGRNNYESLLATYGTAGAGPPAVVYFTVQETTTHFFAHYFPYMPIDDKSGNGHEHDTESVLLVIRKAPAPAVEAMETRWHSEWKTYAGGLAVLPGTDSQHAGVPEGVVQTDALAGGNGHPLVMRQRVGHGLCGGNVLPGDPAYPESSATPETEWVALAVDSGQLVCGGEPIEPYGSHVVYRFATGTAESPKPGALVQTVGYELREILTTLWLERTNETLFSTPMTYTGSVANGCAPTPLLRSFRGDCNLEFCTPAGTRCASLDCRGTCGQPGLGCGEDPPSIWGQSSDPATAAGKPAVPRPPNGEQFFDPAGTMSRRLSFVAGIATTYVHNPYLGIVDGVVRCPQ